MCAHLHTAGSFWHGAWELPDELVPVLGEQHLALPYLPSERGSPLVLLVLQGSMEPGHGRAEAGMGSWHGDGQSHLAHS